MIPVHHDNERSTAANSLWHGLLNATADSDVPFARCLLSGFASLSLSKAATTMFVSFMVQNAIDGIISTPVGPGKPTVKDVTTFLVSNADDLGLDRGELERNLPLFVCPQSNTHA